METSGNKWKQVETGSGNQVENNRKQDGNTGGNRKWKQEVETESKNQSNGQEELEVKIDETTPFCTMVIHSGKLCGKRHGNP